MVSKDEIKSFKHDLEILGQIRKCTNNPNYIKAIDYTRKKLRKRLDKLNVKY